MVEMPVSTKDVNGGDRRRLRAGWVLALVGVGAAAAAVLGDGAATRSAANQDWPPFVLVAGLLLVGLVADEDGLFAAAGTQLARVAKSGVASFVGAAVLIALVTSVLNLDTSVAFLTPVLVHAARSRGDDDAPFLYGCILLSNAASLLLPGSNLTNLIVLGHRRLPGGVFLHHVAGAWLVAVVVTAVVVGLAERRALRAPSQTVPRAPRPDVGVGAVAVAAVTVLVLVLRSPALPVAAVGVGAVVLHVARARWWGPSSAPGTSTVRRVPEVVGVPVLVGLFGVAVALGTLGRVWSGPATLLSHLDAWGTAAVAAGASVLVNNLPAASLLAARVPHRPLALLVGLDVGPNLFATGSLSWILWYRAARLAGARPSIARASLYGVISAPLAMAGALGVLALAGNR
jgi:arsenical pump membrane protein